MTIGIIYLIDVLWILGCLGGAFYYRTQGPYAGVGALVAACCGVIIVHVLLGPVVGSSYRPLF